MSGQQLQVLDDKLSNLQDCQDEVQLLEGLSQLSSVQDMLEVLETYLLYNEPCINIPVTSTLPIKTKRLK